MAGIMSGINAAIDSLNGTKARSIRHYSKYGESLKGLARMFYGDPELWELIYRYNYHVIDNPMILQPGTSIIIPYDDRLRIQVLADRLG